MPCNFAGLPAASYGPDGAICLPKPLADQVMVCASSAVRYPATCQALIDESHAFWAARFASERSRSSRRAWEVGLLGLAVGAALGAVAVVVAQ